MKFQIPLDRSITFDVIKEFCNLYYPEMPTSIGYSLAGHYMYLQKNPWVCAFFIIRHKEKKGVTNIYIRRDSNTMARIIGGFLLNYFIRGNFYKEVDSKFIQFLHDRGVEHVVQSAEGEAKLGVWLKKYGLKILAFIVANIIAVAFTVGVGLWSESIFHPTYTSDYELIEPESSYGYDDDDYYDYEEETPADEPNLYQLKHLPTGKIVYQSDEYFSFSYSDEVLGHALLTIDNDDYISYKALLFDEDGNKKVLSNSCGYAYFVDDGIICIRSVDYDSKSYVDFDGNSISNWKTFVYQYRGEICITLMILFFVIANVVCWLIVCKKKKAAVVADNESTLEIVGTAVAVDNESTNAAN